MLRDNKWIIVYDMLLAKDLATKKLGVDPECVRPEFLFDTGYACWQEIYPGEQEEIRAEKQEILKLLKQDQKKYLETIQSWNIDRIEKLKEAGWRKTLMA
jgi:hypothetical protein